MDTHSRAFGPAWSQYGSRRLSAWCSLLLSCFLFAFYAARTPVGIEHYSFVITKQSRGILTLITNKGKSYYPDFH